MHILNTFTFSELHYETQWAQFARTRTFFHSKQHKQTIFFAIKTENNKIIYISLVLLTKHAKIISGIIWHVYALN